MTTIIAVRAPYPRIKEQIHRYQDPRYLYFIDTSDLSDDFYDFHKKLRTAWEFLLEIRDIRGGKMRIDFGTDFKEALLNAVIEEDADRLVLPVEEAGPDFPCEVSYL